MMARSSTRSNQKPDTLMQDRIRRIDENLLPRTAEPYTWVNSVELGPFATFPLYLNKSTCCGQFQDRRSGLNRP